MTKREEKELAEATHRVVARWDAMSDAERTERLKVAGILDDNGVLSPRYRTSSNHEKPRTTSAAR